MTLAGLPPSKEDGDPSEYRLQGCGQGGGGPTPWVKVTDGPASQAVSRRGVCPVRAHGVPHVDPKVCGADPDRTACLHRGTPVGGPTTRKVGTTSQFCVARPASATVGHPWLTVTPAGADLSGHPPSTRYTRRGWAIRARARDDLYAGFAHPPERVGTWRGTRRSPTRPTSGGGAPGLTPLVADASPASARPPNPDCTGPVGATNANGADPGSTACPTVAPTRVA